MVVVERTHEALRRNLAGVRERIARARADAGRADPTCPIRLVAITKSVSPAIALALAEAGQADLGENRADELERKAAFFARHGATDSVRWHFVGHLQRNKARRVARIAATIHSVDSLVLVETLARIAGEEDARPGIYVQVHLSGEAYSLLGDGQGVYLTVEMCVVDRRGCCSSKPKKGLLVLLRERFVSLFLR